MSSTVIIILSVAGGALLIFLVGYSIMERRRIRETGIAVEGLVVDVEREYNGNTSTATHILHIEYTSAEGELIRGTYRMCFTPRAMRRATGYLLYMMRKMPGNLSLLKCAKITRCRSAKASRRYNERYAKISPQSPQSGIKHRERRKLLPSNHKSEIEHSKSEIIFNIVFYINKLTLYLRLF